MPERKPSGTPTHHSDRGSRRDPADTDLSFDAILDDERARSIGREHTATIILRLLDDTTRAKALAALNDRSIPNAVIARALTRMGHPVSEGAVRNWRIASGL